MLGHAYNERSNCNYLLDEVILLDMNLFGVSS